MSDDRAAARAEGGGWAGGPAGPAGGGPRPDVDPDGASADPGEGAGQVAAAQGDPPDPEATWLELAGLLRRSASGLGFIYTALDLVAARHGLRDAVLVLDDTTVGRQVFRLRGDPAAPRAAADDRWLHSVIGAGSGLHADPAVVDATTAGYVFDLATTALRLDLLSHDASHDPLTGLLNRRSYDAALDEAVARSRRYGWPFALVMLDLDNFKAVNDQLGHAAGDEALRVLGRELRGILRGGDLAARLGGDEFALIVLNAESPAVLEPLASRLRQALEREAPSARIAFSAGVACFPQDADDVALLQRIADERLYADKVSVA